MKIIVIIPARSGSKSLPNKNILPLNGKPLIYYSISYALKSKIVDKVIVSTDSDEGGVTAILTEVEEPEGSVFDQKL